MKYIKGDLNADGSRYLPFEDELMEYKIETHQYYLKTGGIKSKLGFDISSYVQPPLTDKIVIDEISDQIYEYIKDNPNVYYPEVAEFMAARLINARDGIYRAMIAQLRYAFRTGNNLKEYEQPLSKRAKDILASEQYGCLAHKGAVTFRVKRNSDNPKLPNLDDADGYRNGY